MDLRVIPTGNQAVDSPRQAESRVERERAASFADVLHSLGSAIDQGERLTNRMVAGNIRANLDSADLLTLQAGVYRYSEAIDLASKLVERLGSSLRTTMQTTG